MLMWVDMVLKPYVDTAPEDVVPILNLVVKSNPGPRGSG